MPSSSVPMVRCPVCRTLLERPAGNVKFVCGRCGQKIRVRAHHAASPVAEPVVASPSAAAEAATGLTASDSSIPPREKNAPLVSRPPDPVFDVPERPKTARFRMEEEDVDDEAEINTGKKNPGDRPPPHNPIAPENIPAPAIDGNSDSGEPRANDAEEAEAPPPDGDGASDAVGLSFRWNAADARPGDAPDEDIGPVDPGAEDRPASDDPVSLADARSLWGDAVDDDDASEGASLEQGGARTLSSSVMDAITLSVRSITRADDNAPARSDLQIREKIGKGGMGMIFAARQASLNRRVAVKVILPDYADRASARNKFIAEAVVTGTLDHPHIVPVHELGITDDGTLFYAMKEVRGRPWTELIGRLDEAENLDILFKVGEAVAFAHDHGVIHRDIKPENVMVGDYGEVLLMDWGLAVGFTAAADGRAERLGPHNARGGTPAYMAPEMARGQADRIGPASDVYLLGGVLYEIVTGLKPHHGDHVYACIFQAMQGRLQPTAKRGELLNIALRALDRDPARRFPSVKAMLTELREYRTHRDSIDMARTANELLARGESDDGYETLARAMFGFEEAARLWKSNGSALAGASKSRLAYARRALERGDYDLAYSVAQPLFRATLDRDFRHAAPADRPLLKARHRLWADASVQAEAIATSAERGRRQTVLRLRRERWMTRAVVALGTVLAVGGGTMLNKSREEQRQTAGLVAQRDELVDHNKRLRREQETLEEKYQAQERQFKDYEVRTKGEIETLRRQWRNALSEAGTTGRQGANAPVEGNGEASARALSEALRRALAVNGAKTPGVGAARSPEEATARALRTLRELALYLELPDEERRKRRTPPPPESTVFKTLFADLMDTTRSPDGARAATRGLRDLVATLRKEGPGDFEKHRMRDFQERAEALAAVYEHLAAPSAP